MSIDAIGSSAPIPTGNQAQQPQKAQEVTTVTTHCDKKHNHDRSCPHTVSTRPAPKAGESGYYLDKMV